MRSTRTPTKGRRTARLGVLALAMTLAGGLVSGCGLESGNTLPFDVQPGSIQQEPSLQGVQITVGSKDFTENIVLGYIAEIALAASGAQIIDLTNIQGSNSARLALESGDIDLYWDYSGTGWQNYLGHTDSIPDIQKQYEAVREEDARVNNIAWMQYSPVNNHYAFGMSEANWEKFGKPETVSDMSRLMKERPDESSLCLETEFASRPDGYPLITKRYGLPNNIELKRFGLGAIYAALNTGSCTFGEVFETDGRILALNLKILKDDKAVLPQYSSSVTVRTDFDKQYPAIRRIMEPISQRLNNDIMRDLNARVDVKGEEAAQVARDWMVREGLIADPERA